MKNANPATSPTMVAMFFGSERPMASSNAPITIPRNVIHSFFAQTEDVCR